MNALPSPGFIAGSTVSPSQFVNISSAGDWTVIPATAGSAIIGVSQDYMAQAPGTFGADITVAANTGQGVAVFGAGQIAMVNSGAAITRGQFIKSDANGNAIPLTTNNPVVPQFIGGVAMESALAAGNLIRIWVQLGQISQ